MKRQRHLCIITNLPVSAQSPGAPESEESHGHISEASAIGDETKKRSVGYLRRGKKRSVRIAMMVKLGVALLLLALVVPIIYALPSGDANCDSNSIAIGGSTALFPLVSTVTNTYHDICPHVMISINQNVASSKAGLDMLGTGNIQIGASDLISSNLSLVDHPLAAVIYVMIVNPDVSQVSELSTPQIQNIYNGSFTDWSEVGGDPEPIFVVNRTSSSGTRATFQKYLLGGTPTPFPMVKTGNYDEEDTSEIVAQKVAATPGAIGYVDLRDALLATNLKIVTIDGIQATSDNVKKNIYHFWTVEHIYTQRKMSNSTHALIEYMTGNGVKQIMSNLGYMPLNDIPSAIVNTHPGPLAPNGL